MKIRMKKIYHVAFYVFALALGACGSGTGHSSEEGAGHEEAHGHGHEHGEGDDVELSQAQMEAVGIRLGGLEARNVEQTLRAPGMLEVGADAEGAAAPLLGGKVTRILAVVGQMVKAGQVVAYIDSPEILPLRQQLREARQEVEAARIEVDRQQALASQGAGIRKNLDNALSSLKMAEVKVSGLQTRLAAWGVGSDDASGSSVPVKASISGVVTSVDVPVGGYADIQLPVLKIVNTKGVYCTLQILEKDIASVKDGMEVQLQLTNDPSKTFTGRVASVSPVLDGTTRTVPVRVNLKEVDSGLRLIPGMAVTGAVSTSSSMVAALPEGAVVSSGGKSYIFVLEETKEEGATKTYRFEKREVVTGGASMGYVAVTPLEALDEDDKVVVAGAFYLNSMVSDHGEHDH